MALDPGSGRRSVSPESSGRDSPIPPQWRNQLGGEPKTKDKNYKRYAVGVEKVLALFDTALEEWADYISFLNKLLKALQARPTSIARIPASATVAKRLSQCLDPSLPSGVHQKALDVYAYIFTTIGKDGLSRELPIWLPGLSSTLSFASLSVRSPFLDILDEHFLSLDPRSLRPAMRSIILTLLPGLEEETSEDFERTVKLLNKFKEAVRPADSGLLTDDHSTGDQFFWQCFFLASITGQGRRAGALAYLVRYLPTLVATPRANADGAKVDRSNTFHDQLAAMVTSPEPGLLIRCFATGLGDEQLLIQRGFLDLLVTHLPLNSTVLQDHVKAPDLQLLLKAAVGVVTRREMSLNRRLWAWFLGPEQLSGETEQVPESPATPSDPNNAMLQSRTSFFEEFGLQPLTKALLAMIQDSGAGSASDRARPYRICLSLMDRWEIGGLVVPEVFLPVVDNVRQFKTQAKSNAEFVEVLRSASVFFDGIESGLIYSELIGLLAQAMAPGEASMEERRDRLDLVLFILEHFNVREEEMITIHAPLCCLASLSMLEDYVARQAPETEQAESSSGLQEQLLKVASALLELVPERAFTKATSDRKKPSSNAEILKRTRAFYVHEQGNIDVSPAPFGPVEIGEILLDKAVRFIRGVVKGRCVVELRSRIRFLLLVLLKTPETYKLDRENLLPFLQDRMVSQKHVVFSEYSSVVHLATQMHSLHRISTEELSELVLPLVQHAWAFLSASEPKYHVEAVRCLWYLQTSLSSASREVEAALCTLIVGCGSALPGSTGSVDIGRTFGILWSHTLQDNVSERRGPKTPLVEHRSSPRLSGMEYYEVMLTQPLFLVLDSLLDERTQLFMTVKSWLNSMIGIDRLFLIFVSKFTQMRFLENIEAASADSEASGPGQIQFSEDDDLELCLYYLRTLSNILRCSSEVSWNVVATKHISFEGGSAQMSSGNNEGDITLQDFFVRVCVRCITGDAPLSASPELNERISELQRFALSTLHVFFSGRFASSFSSLHLENTLIQRLASSLSNSDPYVQVLLLEVVHDTLKLRDMTMPEPPASPVEKRQGSIDPSRPSRASIALSETRPTQPPPPPQLLKCLQSGLSSPQSRMVLDSWIRFLGQCLPFYANTIFQVVIPLVETFCKQISFTFASLKDTFHLNRDSTSAASGSPESTLIHLLNGLEQVLAAAHAQLLSAEARAQLTKSPDQPQSIFGSMVSNVWQSDSPQSRSATANDRLTVHLAFQDATRMCYSIWCWGQGDEASQQDPVSSASFNYTSLRMRNRARRLLEHLFHAEPLECLETVIDIWNKPGVSSSQSQVFNLLSALDASRPRHTIPALFNAIYSRTNPSALEPHRKSTLTISLEDTELVIFLVEYARSLDDDAMDEIWSDCITFLRDILSNPFPHRQTLPRLLEFAAILGEKVDNTNFGEQRRMRRDLGDLFLRLLTALFTTRPVVFTDSTNGTSEKAQRGAGGSEGDDGHDVVSILASVVPELPKVLVDQDRVLSAAGTISSSAIAPTIRAKAFPDTVSKGTLKLLHELSRLQNNQKTWKKDVGDAFNDSRFFSMNLSLVKEHWLPLLRLWTRPDKEKLPEIVSRINPPTTAGIVFGVGATSARLEADRKTQVNLRRVATLVLSSAEDTFVADLPLIVDKLVELLTATATSSPSATTRADVYMVMRALVLKTSPIHMATLWPVVNSEIHAAMSSVVAPDSSSASNIYNNATVLQACKLLDLLICVAPDDFQLHEWLFITDTIDAIYRSHNYQPVSLVDELSEELSNSAGGAHIPNTVDAGALVAGSSHRRPLIGSGGISDDISLERRDELVAKILRPFFSQLSIFAFESTYAMVPLDRELCLNALLEDLFEEKTIVKAL
ncbi:protein dopey [Sarocladium implicatum]|nr:protein dopey [Sarocladium implicatum]